MDNRTDQRFPLAMKAFPMAGSLDAVLETDNVSAGGAYFVGDPGVPAGSSFWMRVELGSAPRGKESIFPLCLEVRVARLTRSGDGSVAGFGAEWRAAWAPDDATPLKEFLRRTLALASGYIEAIPAATADGRSSYLYVFPATGTPSVESATAYEEQTELEAAPLPVKAPAVTTVSVEGGIDLDVKATPTLDPRSGLAVYVAVPLTWSIDEGEFEGRAIKLTATGLRVATMAELPGSYRRITIHIPIRQRDKSGTLALAGTVVTQRPPKGEGQESQFDIQLTLGNEPDSLQLYRRLLDRLSSMAAPVGA